MITVHQVNNLSADNANGIVTPINDRRFYNMLVGGESGVVQGCEVTAIGSTQLRVDDGWGIVSGCLFTIEAETIDATLSASDTVNGRLLLQVDVSQSVGTFITQAAASLPALQQDDLTASGSIYQLELATYTASSIAIENVEQTFATVGSSGFSSYAVQKNGTVFALSGVGNNVKFIAPAAFEDGNTFTVNGTAVTALTQDGEALSGGYFASGAVVTAYLNGSTLYFKSGGAALNFKVVGGTTQPANPSENTIWVNTDTAITSWVFAAEAPAIAADGMVWVQTATIAPNAFNALKKNTLMAYPIGVFMYDGAAWATATAQIFYGGEWHGFELLLYERGTLFNQDVIPILNNGASYNTDHIGLNYQSGTNVRGIYTQTAPPNGYSTVHMIVRSDLGGGYTSDAQYGQNTLTASLPTIVTTGSGRVSYESITVPGTETEITINITGAYGFFIGCTNSGRSAIVYKIWLT